MVGASDGRVYQGESRNGVSVFDFKVQRNGKKNGRWKIATDIHWVRPHLRFAGIPATLIFHRQALTNPNKSNHESQTRFRRIPGRIRIYVLLRIVWHGILMKPMYIATASLWRAGSGL